MIGLIHRTGVAVGAGLLVLAASAGTADAATPATAGSGYLAASSAFGSAAMTLEVPTVRCSTSAATGTQRYGFFGSLHNGSSTLPWFLAVSATCRAGHSSYSADFGSPDGGQPLRVHRGDSVRLVVSDGGQSFEIDDLTSGSGAGGGITTGPGPATPDRHVLVGGRVSGARLPAVTASLHAIVVDGRRLQRVPNVVQVQRRGPAPLFDVSRLGPHGTSFVLTSR